MVDSRGGGGTNNVRKETSQSGDIIQGGTL